MVGHTTQDRILRKPALGCFKSISAMIIIMIGAFIFSCNNQSPSVEEKPVKVNTIPQSFVTVPSVGYADPIINILSEAPSKKVNQYNQIKITAGNAGNSGIEAGTLRIILSCGTNSRITSLITNTYWKQYSLSKEKVSNTIILTNKYPFAAGTMSECWVRAKGVVKGEASTVSANIGYWQGRTSTGALNASQGNLSSTNDNSTTSLTVR